jgi:hypothetical protein
MSFVPASIAGFGETNGSGQEAIWFVENAGVKTDTGLPLRKLIQPRGTTIARSGFRYRKMERRRKTRKIATASSPRERSFRNSFMRRSLQDSTSSW